MFNNYEFSEDFINYELKKSARNKDRFIDEPITISQDKVSINVNLMEDNIKLRNIYIKWKKNVYRGEMKFINGKYKFDGYGKLYEDNLFKYDGGFKNGLFHGKGILTNYQNIKRYDGEFENSQYNGYGKLYEFGILKYEGQFKNGQFHGKGKFNYLQKKKSYEGNFENGKYNGFGILTDNNKIYEGNFKNGNYNGFGRLYDDKLLSYEGEFKNGYKHGYGKEYYHIIENKYIITEGYFYYNKYNGYIEIKDYDGSVIRKELYISGEKINFGENNDLKNMESSDILKIFAEQAAYYKDKYDHIIKEIYDNDF